MTTESENNKPPEEPIDVLGVKPLKVWEKQTNETTKMFHYFLAFLRQGPERTIDQAAKDMGKSAAYMYSLSGPHDWINRAAEFDLANQVKAVDDMSDAQRDAYVALAEKQQERAASYGDMADKIMRQCARRLAHVEKLHERALAKDPETTPPILDKETLAAVKIAVEVGNASGEAEALALGVDRVMSILEEGGDK